MNMFRNLAGTVSIFLGITFGVAVLSTAAQAEDGKKLFAQSCAGCHQIEAAKILDKNLHEKIDRKGPPLHFAGHKYQQAWLENWLQNPKTITPTGGDYWANSVVVTDEGDEIDTQKVATHLAIKKSDAHAIGLYLSALKPHPELMNDGEYKPKRVSKMLAAKDFRKFKGCGSCHRDKEDFGGVSGPELYTAMNRLQPEYVASYIRNPQAWEPRSLMPNKGLNDPSIHKLMNYLNLLKE